MYCDRGGRDSCQGDSGGPLVTADHGDTNQVECYLLSKLCITYRAVSVISTAAGRGHAGGGGQLGVRVRQGGQPRRVRGGQDSRISNYCKTSLSPLTAGVPLHGLAAHRGSPPGHLPPAHSRHLDRAAPAAGGGDGETCQHRDTTVVIIITIFLY